uniref:SCP domain-containing protein n=1 Tax=Globodera pallida TaxID=36090 RepID=A0A183BKF3_GLOPA
MKKEGQILTISEAMKAIQTASRAIFILNEPAQECPTYIDYGGDWQKQVEALEEWHKQNIKKMPPLAKADMVIHHAFTNAQKRVSKHHLH